MIDSVRHLGARLQGQRLPLRPDGPPLQAEHAQPARRPRRADRCADDGVDGRAIYLYGEGWNFGEVADDARFVQATQRNLAGTGIGTFSDRLRDAVRGGGPFDEDPRVQGFGSGLYTDPNGVGGQRHRRASSCAGLLPHAGPGQARPGRQPRRLRVPGLHRRDRRRAATSTTTASRPGYAADPSEVVTYVDAHDNETLFDALALKLPAGHVDGRPGADEHPVAVDGRARRRAWSFWHAGTDLLRSKSLDRNSYDSGDWFNRVDWTAPGQHLRLRAAAGGRTTAPSGTTMRPLLADPALKPDADAMDAAPRRGGRPAAHPALLAALPARRASAAIQAKVSFLRADPGVDRDADRRHRREPTPTPTCDGVLVVFNATPDGHHGRGHGSGLDSARGAAVRRGRGRARLDGRDRRGHRARADDGGVRALSPASGGRIGP